MCVVLPMKTHVFDEYAALALVALAAFSLTLFFSGCSQTELSAIQKREMIAQLDSAKTQDQKNAVESYDPIEAADCRDHAYTAELTLGNLTMVTLYPRTNWTTRWMFRRHQYPLRKEPN
jgi:hypothetical protein